VLRRKDENRLVFLIFYCITAALCNLQKAMRTSSTMQAISPSPKRSRRPSASLPIFPELTDAQSNAVSPVVKEFFAKGLTSRLERPNHFAESLQISRKSAARRHIVSSKHQNRFPLSVESTLCSPSFFPYQQKQQGEQLVARALNQAAPDEPSRCSIKQCPVVKV